MAEHADKKLVHFTVDGHAHTTTDPTQSVAEILRSDGLDPAVYALTEVRGHGQHHEFPTPETEVHIKDGAVFISLKVRGEVA